MTLRKMPDKEKKDIVRHIDGLCDELSLKIEDLRHFLKIVVGERNQQGLLKDRYPEADYKRSKLLEQAIQEAISELEKTKSSFRSKKIKEVREKLTKIVKKI